MNFCPVCTREYRKMRSVQTRYCPVCGSTLVQTSGNELNRVRGKKNSHDTGQNSPAKKPGG